MERTVRGEKRPRPEPAFTMRITTERRCHSILCDRKELKIWISSKTPVMGILPPCNQELLRALSFLFVPTTDWHAFIAAVVR
jgi:hypothetical protein